MLIHEDFPLHLPLSKIWSQGGEKKKIKKKKIRMHLSDLSLGEIAKQDSNRWGHLTDVSARHLWQPMLLSGEALKAKTALSLS